MRKPGNGAESGEGEPDEFSKWGGLKKEMLEKFRSLTIFREGRHLKYDVWNES